jgi:hypothetical protein
MLADVQTLADDLVRDTASLIAPERREAAIEIAVARYSADRPREVVAAVASADGLRLPMPTGWGDGMEVVAVEWPVGEIPPARVQHVMNRGLSGLEILLGTNVGAGGTAHVHFTRPHIVTDTEDTIPAVHREGVAAYAAALLFEQLAANAAGNGEPTIQADSVDHRSQAAEYAARARAMRKRYAEVIGALEAPVTRPAGATVSWPARQRFPGAGAARR